MGVVACVCECKCLCFHVHAYFCVYIFVNVYVYVCKCVFLCASFHVCVFEENHPCILNEKKRLLCCVVVIIDHFVLQSDVHSPPVQCVYINSLCDAMKV